MIHHRLFPLLIFGVVFAIPSGLNAQAMKVDTSACPWKLPFQINLPAHVLEAESSGYWDPQYGYTQKDTSIKTSNSITVLVDTALGMGRLSIDKDTLYYRADSTFYFYGNTRTEDTSRLRIVFQRDSGYITLMQYQRDAAPVGYSPNTLNYGYAFELRNLRYRSTSITSPDTDYMSHLQLYRTYISEMGFHIGGSSSSTTKVYSVDLSHLLTVLAPSSVVADVRTPIMQPNAFPNPLTSLTELRIATQESSIAQITIVNLLGQTVTEVFFGFLDGGDHSFMWNAGNVPVGCYRCIIRSNGAVQEIPLTVVR